MRITVRHDITYAYDKPVFVGPHLLRLRPLSNATQTLTNFQYRVDPQPQLTANIRDTNDNDAISAWFTGTTDTLSISIKAEVETLVENPFEYILDLNANSFDTLYDDDLKRILSPYLEPVPLWADRYGELSVASESDLEQLERELRDDSAGVPIELVSLLNVRLKQRFKLVVRPDGDPYPPMVTLGKSEAACRDIVVLAMALCRRAGIATRFVSGYSVPDRDASEHHMHAWMEVYLPGAGWRGYDPTSGLAVADRHIAVAKAADPADAAPVTGTVRGDDVIAKMSATVRVEVGE